MAIFTVGFNPAIDRIMECPDFHIGGHQIAAQIARLASGKAANVSRALALVGTDSIATGFIGTDELEFFHDQLMSVEPGRILCRFVEVSGKTRENITVIDPKRHLETHLRDRGFIVTPAEAALLHQRLSHDVHPGDIVAFSGSLCGGLEPAYLLDLIDRANAIGARVALDSSGESLEAAARKKLWLLKPNLEELRILLHREVPDDAPAIRDAVRQSLPNIDHVIVSRGAPGAVLVTPAGAWSARTTSTAPAVRTVACGDHLLAGFIAELSAGRDVEPALRTAIAVATARAHSTDMSEFPPEAVRAALATVELEHL